ncbi:hypothetical protein [Citrobacter europaeus]|uniref:hypothetical protein n=1 Tax=Citrobacter europaeus TaxID=1914243 RepID=UPI0039C4CA4D
MTATNKPMTGAQLDELMAVAMRMQSDSEKMGDRSVSMFAYAVQVAVLEIRETRCKYEELQSQNADMAVQLANAESKCRELAGVVAENAGLKNFIINDCHVAHIEPETFYEEEVTRYVSADGYEPETPATDAFLAEVRAQGVEMFSEKFGGGTLLSNMVKETAKEFAAQLRKGAAL